MHLPPLWKPLVLAAALAGWTSAAADYKLLWGDIHNHTSYSQDARALQMERYGRLLNPAEALANAMLTGPDGLPLDFVTITDHAESFTVDSSLWGKDIGFVQDFDAAHGFECVAFPGFEYTNSVGTPGHGHRCVVFETLDAAKLPLQPIGYDAATCPDAQALWDKLSGFDNYLTIPHHPAKGEGQHYAETWLHSVDWDYIHPSQALVEIYSVHGNSERAPDAKGRVVEEAVSNFRANSSVDAALGRFAKTHNPLYKLGIVASTDMHLSHPGTVAESDTWVVRDEGPYTGGLVAALAVDKSRANVFEALKSKRTYATSGPRIVLSFAANHAGQRAVMGETLVRVAGEGVSLAVSAAGDTAGIAKIEFFRDGELVKSESFSGLQPGQPATATYTDTNPPDWGFYRVKAYQANTRRVNDDYYSNPENEDHTPELAPERAWSSPIFVETRSRPAVVLSVPELSVSLDSDATFGVKLSSAPTGTAQVETSAAAGDGSVTVKAGASLSFTPDNWDAWQEVTLSTAVDTLDFDTWATFSCSGAGLAAATLTAIKATKNTDRFAPAAVADLAVTAKSATRVQLAWTAPGSDGVYGQAATYDLRYSDEPITALNWAACEKCAIPPAPGWAGSGSYFLLQGLAPATKYYLALKTADASDNVSDLSNVVELTTDAMVVSLENVPDSRTREPTALITVGGEGVTAYKYSLDGSAFGAAAESSQPLSLTGLSEGQHTLRVIGMDWEGSWQPEAAATSYAWKVWFHHSADYNPADWQIDKAELLRVLTLFNNGLYYQVDAAGPDGYSPSPVPAAFAPGLHHSADYSPPDGRIDIVEMLRVVTLFNDGLYYQLDPAGPDGYGPAAAPTASRLRP